MKITLTTTKNQINITYDNMTSINLGECEIVLRYIYNISEDKLLYMKKIDVYQKGMKIPKVEFDIYCKLNGTNLVRLDKSFCEKEKISISVPVETNEDNDKLNASGVYYNNICSKAKSDNGTDILLKDRQKEYVEGNKTVCQDGCILIYYDKNIQKANCSCDVVETSTSISNMTINKTKLYESFDDNNQNKFSNLGVTGCNVFVSTENIKSNSGFFILSLIVVSFIIIFIIFCTKGYRMLEYKIDEVIYKRFREEKKAKPKKKVIKIETNKIIRTRTKTKRIETREINNNIKTRNQRRETLNQSSITQSLFLKKSKNKKSIMRPKNKNSINNHKTKNLINMAQNNRLMKKVQSNNTFVRQSSNLIQSKNNKKSENQNYKPDTDYELNWLTYKDALIYDKRTKCDYYGSLLRSKQLFIFTFCSFNDYNSGIIKKFMLFLSFALHYTVNALFFGESNMHQIYEDQGKYNFVYQIPYIISSAVISTLTLRLMLQFLVLTDKDILEVKLQATKDSAFNLKIVKLKYMKVKFTIFFILNFILLGLFWYYLTCFNAIYENTQIYLIENTFISFGFSLFYPFIINIFPIMIRMCSLHDSKKDKECFYKTSQILQIL